MSVTRDEAILLSAYTGFLLVPDFSEVHKFCEDALGRPIFTHEFADRDVQKEIQEKLRPQIIKLIQNISALRFPMREMVERMRGEWIEDEFAISHCSLCGYEQEEPELITPFCPLCGSPMTDEAVEMVMERLEALHGETD